MKIKFGFFCFFILIIVGGLIISCQKEINGLTSGVLPSNEKPKVGTIWTYSYYTFNSLNGGVAISKDITHKAKNEENIGGEIWLNIVDLETDTTVYLLNTKTGGLYQYTNSNSYLFCKYPAILNDTYTTFNTGSTEDFTVKGANDTLPTNIGDIVTNYYEGVKNSLLIDMIWYNTNVWIARRTIWRKSPLGTTYYKYSSMFIKTIVY